MQRFPGSMSDELCGAEYTVNFRISRLTGTGYSRGDHGMGGGEYDYSYWSGEIIVRDRNTNKLIAACHYGLDRSQTFGRNEDKVACMIFGERYRDEFLTESSEKYADMVARKVIEVFKNHTLPCIPSLSIHPFNWEELVAEGIISDMNEQVPLILS